MTNLIVTVEGLTKRYGSTTAVDGISFELRAGEVFGLLGPNGAGKTTTLECLEGLREPDGGRISFHIQGKRADAIGVQLQSAGLPPGMRVDEAMRFFCAYHGVSPRFDLLDRMGIGEKRSAQFRTLSVGQQRRLALALAVAHRPALLFLDEPTAGLDVESRNELHALLGELKREGTSIILASHDMAEVEKLADRISILLRGRIAANGTPLEITAQGNGATRVSVRSARGSLLENGTVIPAVDRRERRDDYAVFFSVDTAKSVAAILAALDRHTDPLLDLRVERPSLEERFLEITTNGGSR